MPNLILDNMSRQITQPRLDLFPLHQVLHDLNIRQVIQHKQPIILLSQIKKIDRVRVEQLERMGIYDTEDFFNVGNQLAELLQLDELQFEELYYNVQQELREQSKRPRLILDLPQNYALISVQITSTSRRLGLWWRGMYWTKSVPREAYWNLIKQEFDHLLLKMKDPELLGRITLKRPPQWLDQVIPLSTYIGNLPFHQEIVNIAQHWGLPAGFDDLDTLQKEILASEYLLHIAHIE